MIWRILALSLIVLKCGALSSDERLACTRGLICMIKKETLEFFVVGDTGGVSLGKKHSKLANQSKPTETQLGVAEMMTRRAAKHPVDFIINVGDNVYSKGVADANDPRFKAVFEEPYADKSLQVPWYMIAGNHDHMGNVAAQFEYTKKSNKWTFPYYFYKASYAFGKNNTRADFIFIDTIVLCGLTLDDDGNSVENPSDVPEAPEKTYSQLAKLQWLWIEEQLKTSKAEYLFVTGHYPIYTISGNQVIKCLEKRLDPLLRKYKATAYFAGHHHTLQYFYDSGKKSGSEMHYIVSGAGSRLNNNRHKKKGVGSVKLLFRYPLISDPKFKVGIGSGGFVSFSINSTGGTFHFHGNGTHPILQATLKPRTIN